MRFNKTSALFVGGMGYKFMNIKRRGFTVVEILIVAPIVILVIGAFISAIVSMTGEVLVSRGSTSLLVSIQDALNRIEQDITTSGAYLATNNINIVSPQGYNDDTSSFHNADATNGSMLILNSYATTENPLSSTRNAIYIPNTPNACGSPSINKNIPVVINTVYFVKNNILWRRTIAADNYAIIGCSVPWQQPSCAPNVTNPFCKTQDIRLVDGIQSGGFSVGYYPSPTSTIANITASDSTQTDEARLAALQANSTVAVSITATNTVAGRNVSQTGTIRATSPNNNKSQVAQSRTSCLAILNANESNGDGIYWIKPAGTVLPVYCNMTTDGGGWTQIDVENTASATGWSDGTLTSATVAGVATQVHGMYGVGQSSTKVYSLLSIPHTLAKIIGRYYAVDSWDNEVNGAQVWVDGTMRWGQAHSLSVPGPGVGWVTATFTPCTSWCAYPIGYWNLESSVGNVSHTQDTLTLAFKTGLDQAVADESFAFSHVQLLIR